MKMRIRKYFLPCFLPVIAALCFILLSPVFAAAMEKVDETELARTNASVTGASAKDPFAGVGKGVQENWQANESVSKDTGLSSAVKEEPVNLNMNINGQTTFQFYKGSGYSTVTGGITSVGPLH
jgi:hypothetical protein